MFSFASWLDLPLIWAALIGVAVFFYVLLDGFDLGVGILFPFAPTDECRDKLMSSVAPFWDGNETWLVLGGGGLLAAFPQAYAIIFPALYIPIIVMLIALAFRGVAFEFRFKAHKSRPIWDGAFHFGSLVAAFAQGVILGGIVQGIPVAGRAFNGGALDWLTAFPLMCGIALVSGYTLLGATWLNLKTTGETQRWAKACGEYAIIYVVFFVGIVSLWMPIVHDSIMQRWFSWPNVVYLAPFPVGVLVLSVILVRSIKRRADSIPFFAALGIFTLNFIGLAISLWPWMVPYSVTIWQAASAPESQSLLLIGAVVLLPIVLGYTAYCYYVFRGKTSAVMHY